MKANEIKDMTVDELNSKLAELKQELFNLRFQHAAAGKSGTAPLCKGNAAQLNAESRTSRRTRRAPGRRMP